MAYPTTYKVRISIKSILVSATNPMDAMAVAFTYLPLKAHRLVSSMSAKRAKVPKPKKGEKALPTPKTGQRANWLVTLSVKNILVDAHNAMSASQSAIGSFPENYKQLISSVGITNYGLKSGEVNIPMGWEMNTPTVDDEIEEQSEREEQIPFKNTEISSSEKSGHPETYPEPYVERFFRNFEKFGTFRQKTLFDEILKKSTKNENDPEIKTIWGKFAKEMATSDVNIIPLIPEAQTGKYIALFVMQRIPYIIHTLVRLGLPVPKWL